MIDIVCSLRDGSIARTAPGDPAQRRAIIADILNGWAPDFVRTLKIYSAAVVLDVLAPVAKPDTDYLQVPRALGLAPEITYFEDGEHVDSITAEDWQLGVTGLHDFGRGLRTHERTIADIPSSDTVWGNLLCDPSRFHTFGCTAARFLLAVPDVRSAAAEVLDACGEPDPVAVLAPYIDFPAR